MKQRFTKHYNFYDWFCPDRELAVRGLKCEQFLDDHGIIEQFDDNFSYDFKNCCPVVGDLYDVIRIWDDRTNELVIYLKV